jgi:hypothetical protein
VDVAVAPVPTAISESLAAEDQAMVVGSVDPLLPHMVVDTVAPLHLLPMAAAHLMVVVMVEDPMVIHREVAAANLGGKYYSTAPLLASMPFRTTLQNVKDNGVMRILMGLLPLLIRFQFISIHYSVP